MDLIQCPSPSFGVRRNNQRPDMVVLHYTAMQSAEVALERLNAPDVEVSAHYLISEHGETYQMVDEAMRAWHAGAGRWGETCDVNSRSIGIELANPATHPFPELQMLALEQLLRGILARWAIAPERVIAHSDMAPLRKVDPGPRFDWRRLALGGLSIWPETNDQEGQFLPDAERFGYHAPEGCEDPAQVLLECFRLRFRPWAQGPEDATDRRLIHDLANRFPVDQTGVTA